MIQLIGHRVGHRGFSGQFVENTWRSFEAAFETGVDAVELDLQLSKEGKVVIFHDGTLERLAGDKRAVCKLNVAELKELTLEKGEKILTLEELFQRALKPWFFYLELKEGGETLVKATLDLVKKYEMEERVAFLSFSLKTLKILRAHAPEARIGYNCSYKHLIHTRWGTLKKTVQALSLDHHLLSREFVEKMHHHGFKVYCWTVNDPARMEELASWGVDAIMSDFPDRLKR